MPSLYQARLRHAKYYEQLLRQADTLYAEGGDALLQALAQFDLAWENIHTAHGWVTSESEEDRVVLQLTSDYPDAGLYLLNLRLPALDRIHWFESALRAARRLKLQEAEGWHLGNLALAYAALGETRRAIALYEERLALANRIQDRPNDGRVLGNLANLYASMGETQKAIELYQRRLEIARELDDRRGEASVLANLGDAHADLGKTAQAITFHERALKIFEELKERRSEGVTLVNLARAHNLSGNHATASDVVKQALQISREIQDEVCEGAAFAVYGDALFDQGELLAAANCYDSWKRIAVSLGDRRGEANALWRSSLILRVLGETSAALSMAKAALQLFEEVEDNTATEVRTEIASWSH